MQPQVAKVSGVVVGAQLNELRQRFGAEVVEAVLGKLAPADADELRSVSAISYVPIPALEAFYEQAAARVGTTVEVLHSDTAARVTGRTLTSIWRALLHIASDEMLVARSPAVFKKAYPQGRLEVLQAGTGFAEVKVCDWAHMSEFAVRGLRVGIESVLRAGGRHAPKGTARRTSDGAHLRFVWTNK